MRDIDGDQVFYTDASSAPTSMSCIRSAVSYGALFPNADPELDGSATTADAEQAYIQRKLEPGDNLFIHVPRDLWTPEMIRSAKGMKEPVFRLLRPLYYQNRLYG